MHWIREIRRRYLTTRFEASRGSRLIPLTRRSLSIQVAEQVVGNVQSTEPNKPIDVLLHTPGGLVLAALRIARALRRHSGRVTVFVPHYAMSGGTLIALAADEIVMAEHAVLGPVDPQLGEYPASSLIRAVARKPIEEVDDRTLILADQAEKAVAEVQRGVAGLLEGRMPADRVDELARLLSEGIWSHDHGITLQEARSLGLPVRGGLPPEVNELLQVEPEALSRAPGTPYGFPLPAEIRVRTGGYEC